MYMLIPDFCGVLLLKRHHLPPVGTRAAALHVMHEVFLHVLQSSAWIVITYPSTVWHAQVPSPLHFLTHGACLHLC